MKQELMLFQRMGWLVLFFAQRHISWEKIPRNCAYGREFWAIMDDKTEMILPPFTPPSLTDCPVPYEVQYQMSNWSDCQDWINDNKEKFNSIFPLTPPLQPATVTV